MQNVVYVVGTVAGCVVLAVVLYVFARRQTFGTGGIVLSFFGVLLIGLSVWRSATIKVGDIEIAFERLEEQITQVAEASGMMSEEILKLADEVQYSKERFTDLTNVLAHRQTISSQEKRVFLEPQPQQSRLDRQRLEDAGRALQITRAP